MNSRSPENETYCPQSGYDVATIIYEKGNREFAVKKYHCIADSENPKTLGELASLVGFDCLCYKEGEMLTIILDRPTNGEMWQIGNNISNDYEKAHWFFYGETRGYW